MSEKKQLGKILLRQRALSPEELDRALAENKGGRLASRLAASGAISDVAALKTNADGSIDLYLQKDNPGPEKEANWLPAPEGAFIPMFRLYWPKETPPSASTSSGSSGGFGGGGGGGGRGGFGGSGSTGGGGGGSRY